MDRSQSIFSTESSLVALPGYRWVDFTTHRALKQLTGISPRHTLEKLVADPAFVSNYRSFSSDSHGPYLVRNILAEDFVETLIHQEPHPVIDAILSGTGVYKGCAPEPDATTLERISARLAEISKDSSYFILKLDPTRNEDKFSELGWIFAEYSQHFFVSSSMNSIQVVTIGCE